MKHEAQRLIRMREDARYKRGKTEDDAERQQRLSRMRDYARSRREAEDKSMYSAWAHEWGGGSMAEWL